jgi:UDP-glucose 4-epimerase
MGYDGWRDRVILVTGGAGYLGSQLVRDFAGDIRFAGATIRILDNLQRGNHQGLLDLPATMRYELVEADLLDPSAVRRALQGAGAVVHLAALVQTPFSFDHPTWTEHVNHWGTAHLVDLCLEAGVQRFVYASSTSVYGPGGPFAEDAPRNPLGPYSQSKRGAERVVEVAAGRGLVPTVLRLGTVYGFAPGIRFDAVPNRLVYQAATGRPVTVHGSGEQTRALVHVRDASDSLRFCLAESSTRHQLYNVAAQNASIHEMAETVRAVVPGAEIRYADQHLLTHISLAVDSGRIHAAGWHPRVSIREGLAEVAARLGPFHSLRRAELDAFE